MKTLSIRNPYAYWIACGIKDIENRTWKTNYRGKILIHASGTSIDVVGNKKETPLLYEVATGFKENGKLKRFLKVLKYDKNKEKVIFDEKKYENENILLRFVEDKQIFTQAIIGEVELVDIVNNSKSKWADKGCYHWILKNPKIYENPIKYIKGKLNLWEYKG